MAFWTMLPNPKELRICPPENIDCVACPPEAAMESHRMRKTRVILIQHIRILRDGMKATI
jgi:hypothetical protein